MIPQQAADALNRGLRADRIEEVTQRGGHTGMTWVRCRSGQLLNLASGARISKGDDSWYVVFRLGDEVVLIYPSNTRDEYEAVMDEIAGRLVGHGETRLDFRPENWPRPRIPANP